MRRSAAADCSTMPAPMDSPSAKICLGCSLDSSASMMELVSLRSIRSLNLEIFAGCPRDEEGGLGLANQVGGELAANGMEKRRAGEPSGYSRQQRREEQ